MTTNTKHMTGPTLLLHLARNGVELSIDSDDGTLVVEGNRSRRLRNLIRGRSNELAALIASRCDWFLDIRLREGRRP